MALGAVALLAAVVAGATGAHGQEDPASRALLYLEALQRSDGSIPAPPGSFDPSAL